MEKYEFTMFGKKTVVFFFNVSSDFYLCSKVSGTRGLWSRPRERDRRGKTAT